MTEVAQGWPLRTVSSEASLITNPPYIQISLHFLSSSSNSLLISISVYPSPSPPSLSLPVCFSFLLIKQGQTGFVALTQIGANTPPTLEKSHKRQEGRCWVSDCKGRTPWLSRPGRKQRPKASAHHGSLPGRPGAFLLATPRPLHQASAWLVPARSVQQSWAVAPGWFPQGASNSPGQLLPSGKQPGQVFFSAGPFLTCKAQRRAYWGSGPHKSSKGAS